MTIQIVSYKNKRSHWKTNTSQGVEKVWRTSSVE